MKQRDPEWFAIRCGKITASRIDDLMARTKSGPAASRTNYIAELVAERLTGKPAQSYTSHAMQWGIDNEPLARDAYQFYSGLPVEEVAFIIHPEIDMSGASPDGLVGDNGMLEIKCPNTATHIAFLLDQTIPQKYLYQMQWQMACAERAWCDFVSYDPRMPENMSYACVRVMRDDAEIDRILDEVIAANEEIDEIVTKLKEQYR